LSLAKYGIGYTMLNSKAISHIFTNAGVTRESIGRITMAQRNTHHQKIVEVLADAEMPMDVENVRLQTGLKNWESTKSILLEMVLLGSIAGQKTTKGWIFWLNPGWTRGTRRR
jgi:hypothetical protein